MHVIFITYVWFNDCQIHSKMFVEKNKDTAEKNAKDWLFEEVLVFFNDFNDNNSNIYLEEDLRKIFDDNTLDYIDRFIHEHTSVHVHIEHYSH